MGKISSINSISKKEIYDVVYISHDDLNIKLDSNTEKSDRPCVIVDYNNDKQKYIVLIMTTKQKSKIRQIKIYGGKYNNSYINLDRKFEINKRIIDYAMEVESLYIDDKAIEKINSFIKK